MKKNILTILVLFVASFSVAAQSHDLRVMSYNLRFGELASMEELGKYIASEEPDIVAIQECDWATNRTRAPHQNGVRFVNELAYHSGYFGLYGKTINYRGGYYGIGLLSKYPIIRSERVLLPNEGKLEQRAMLVADIELPGGDIITYACTHLEVNSASLRLKQAKFINKYLSKIARHHQVFLAGDMNAEPDTPEMQYLRKSWSDLTNRELTFSTYNPTIKIDYIYSKPASNVTLHDTEVRTDIKLSDHFPVISNVSIQ